MTTGSGRERRADPRYDLSARVLLSWRERGRDREASGRLIDISQGGAALAVEGAPPASTVVRVCLAGDAPRDWTEAEILGAGPGPDAVPRVRLKFLGRWSGSRLRAAVFGRRDRRAAGHTPSADLESLEGRELLSASPISPPLPVAAFVGPVAATPDVAAQDAPSPATAPAVSLLGIADDPLLSTVLYGTPRRMASGVAADGAVGVNASWEAGQTTTWYIEEQRYGADFVQAGLATNNAALVGQGWQILDWGFAKEAADGSFPGTGDAFHSTSMFVEAGARALLLEVQSGAADAARLVATHLPMLDASAHWLMSPDVAAKGDASDAPYTHRRWLLAAALGEVGELTGDPATIAAAEAYAENGLALQAPDGMNPEKGGGDASYQTYGILLAERYLTVCPDSELCTQIDAMVVKGLQWEVGFISASGQVSIADSTRTGSELSVAGTPKTIDYKTIIQAFSVATTLTGDPSFRVVAQAVASGRGWSVG